MKKKKRIAVCISVILVCLLAAGGAVGNYFYNLALNPAVSKEVIFGEEEESSKEVVNWITETSSYTDQQMISEDGLKLHAYEIKAERPTNVWVIEVHGYAGQGSNQSLYAKGFHQMGFNVLIPDLRGHGRSEGDYIGMGYDDRKDIVKWIDFLINQDPKAQIVLHGVSMGGATVMMTAGEPLPENVKCIIEDCGYSSVWDEFSYQLKSLFGLPSFPVLQLANVVGRIRAGYWFSDASALNKLSSATKPMLFIHGDQDDFVPFSMLQEVYEKADVEKEMLVVKGAGHAKSVETDPMLYWSTVEHFVKTYVVV